MIPRGSPDGKSSARPEESSPYVALLVPNAGQHPSAAVVIQRMEAAEAQGVFRIPLDATPEAEEGAVDTAIEAELVAIF